VNYRDAAMLETFKSQAATWFIGAVIAILTVFSGKIVESLKFSLNRANLRTKNYEQLSQDLSEFVFMAELNHEFLENDWTTKPTLTGLLNDYNDSKTKVRKSEFVYRSWISKYWDKSQLEKFSHVMELIKSYDRILHSTECG
jgi:hypothetical protein